MSMIQFTKGYWANWKDCFDTVKSFRFCYSAWANIKPSIKTPKFLPKCPNLRDLFLAQIFYLSNISVVQSTLPLALHKHLSFLLAVVHWHTITFGDQTCKNFFNDLKFQFKRVALKTASWLPWKQLLKHHKNFTLCHLEACRIICTGPENVYAATNICSKGYYAANYAALCWI